MISLPGAKLICKMKEGDQLFVFKGKIILCNGRHKPLIVTAKGLFPLESVQKEKKIHAPYGLCQCGAIKDALGCPNGH